MKVHLLYFAVLHDITGKREEVLDMPEGARPADVWQSLRDRHRELRDYVQPPMTAINENYVDADQMLRDGDELAFIPPVAGG